MCNFFTLVDELFIVLNIENHLLVIINLIKLTFDFEGMEKRLKLSPEYQLITE